MISIEDDRRNQLNEDCPVVAVYDTNNNPVHGPTRAYESTDLLPPSYYDLAQ